MASKVKIDEDYEPYDHYETEHPITYFDALFHLLKGAFGTGILAFPLAFYHAGYIFGVCGVFVMGMFCIYCLHLVESIEYELCKIRKIPKMNYPQLAICALEEGPWKKVVPYVTGICNVFIIGCQLGYSIVYFIFISENIQKIIESQTSKTIFLWYIITILLVPLILINWVKNLKLLAPLSAFANFLIMISLVIIIYYIFKKGLTFKDRKQFGNLTSYSLFIGTCCFAMLPIGITMPLKNEMKNARKFGSVFGVINIGMLIIILVYVFVGFFGYLAYGKTGGSISYDIGKKKDWLADSCKILLTIAMFFSHALALYVVIDILWNQWLLEKVKAKQMKHAFVYEYLIRTAVVLTTYICASALPYIDTFISLIGCICIASLGITFPAIIDASFHWYRSKHKKIWYWIQIKNFLIFIIGLFIMIVGVVASIKDFIIKIKADRGLQNETVADEYAAMKVNMYL